MKISAKPLFIAYIVIIVLMVVGMFAFGDNYSFYVHREDPANDEVRFETEPEGIVELRDISATDEYYRVTVRAIKPGKTDGAVIYTLDKDNPGKMQQFNSSEYTVTKFNIIMTDNYGFGGNYFTFIGLAMLFLVTTVFFVWAFLKQFREKFFSYRTILFLGLSLYFAIMTAVFGGIYVLTAARHEYFGSAMFFDYAGNALSFVAVFTSPLVLVFAAFMAISNLMLISKEGFRPVNLLGVFIGVFMICGVVVCFALMYYAPYLIGSEAKDIAIYLLKTAVASAFLYFECILFATIVCLQRAGGYKPKLNKDFIIILGCAIKKDGTLYPLLRGRVDKAIDLYRRQLEETGKKAVFVPSGGQGSDEVISEGEAMKRYLLEQGIEEEQIMAETRSTTTLENMKFSAELIKERDPDAKVAFSTTNYHVFRGGMFAREVGLKAAGMGAKTKWYFWPNAEVRENIGLVVNEKWVHVGVVLGLAVISIIVANLGNIMDLIL